MERSRSDDPGDLQPCSLAGRRRGPPTAPRRMARVRSPRRRGGARRPLPEIVRRAVGPAVGRVRAAASDDAFFARSRVRRSDRGPRRGRWRPKSN